LGVFLQRGGSGRHGKSVAGWSYIAADTRSCLPECHNIVSDLRQGVLYSHHSGRILQFVPSGKTLSVVDHIVKRGSADDRLI
jgi:hypothetical protein